MNNEFAKARSQRALQQLVVFAPFAFADEQSDRFNDPDVQTAKLLMKSVRGNRLQKITEYGLYAHVDDRFAE